MQGRRWFRRGREPVGTLLVAGQELLGPAVHGMLLGEEISSLGHFRGDRPQNLVSMKKEVFQAKWGSLMGTGGGDWSVPPLWAMLG